MAEKFREIYNFAFSWAKEKVRTTLFFDYLIIRMT